MLALAKAHPVLISWLVTGLFGSLLAFAGPALFVFTADLLLPGAAKGAAELLHVLLLLFHGSLIVAAALTIYAALRRIGRL